MNSLCPAVRVVESVSEATETDPVDLPSLQDSIDTDALNDLVGSLAGGTVSFEYAGCSVTVESTGTVAIDHKIPTE